MLMTNQTAMSQNYSGRKGKRKREGRGQREARYRHIHTHTTKSQRTLCVCLIGNICAEVFSSMVTDRAVKK